MKPVYQMHRWFARRAGSEFRAVILATFLGPETTEDEFWSLFYSGTNLAKLLGYKPVILDPFMGGGTTIVEGLRLGCKVIGVELNPIAWFLVKKEIEPVSIEEFDEAVLRLKQTLSPEISKYYTTICPQCGGEAEFLRAYWVRIIKCESCFKDVPLFQYFALSRVGESGWIYCPNCQEPHPVEKDKGLSLKTCPNCGETLKPTSNGRKYTCPYCGHSGSVLNAVRTMAKKPSEQMYAILFHCPNCGLTAHKVPDKHDYELYNLCSREVASIDISDLRAQIRYGEDTKRVLAYGIKEFHELFNHRQLLVLSKIKEAIIKLNVSANIRELLLLALSDIIEFNNTMVPWTYTANKVESCFNVHNYLFTQMYAEINAWSGGRGSFLNAVKKIRRGKIYAKKPFERIYKKRGRRKSPTRVYTNDPFEVKPTYNIESLTKSDAILICGSARRINISRHYVDAIITDPPYYDNLIYSGLSDLNYVWLRSSLKQYYTCFQPSLTPRDEEIVVDWTRSSIKGPDRYVRDLTHVFKRCLRALKANGLVVLTFHHRKPAAWTALFKALLSSNLSVRAFWPVRSEGRCYPHTKGRKVILHDAVIVARRRRNMGGIGIRKLKNKCIEEAKILLRELDPDNDLNNSIISMIVTGSLFKVYSTHYPDVYDNYGRRLLIEDVAALAQAIARELITTIS